MVERKMQFSVCEGIIFQIFKFLPVISLMRFKCISKDFLRLIEDPYFADCHSVCAYTRPGGIQLLSAHLFPQFKKGFLSCFLSDPEGNLLSKSVPLSLKFKLDLRRVSYAEALICFENCIWNPSTRESMILPSAGMRFNGRYLLGFDAFTNKYKVLYVQTDKSYPLLKVWTLGENHWKKVHLIPKELHEGIEILSSRSFSNMIFWLIRCDIKKSLGVVTFDVQHEHVGYVPFPNKFKPQKNEFPILLAEIDGRLAFPDHQRALWVLNHLSSKWTEMKITIDGSFNETSWFDYVADGDEYALARLIPLGTIHTNEILFQCFVDEKSYREGRIWKYFYYNFKTKKIWFVSKLDKAFFGEGQYMMIKHVDSLVRLKPPKQQG